MREESRQALEFLANTDIYVEFVNGPINVGTDIFTAMDGTRVTNRIFVPHINLTYCWLRNDEAKYQTQKIINHPTDLGVTNHFFGIADKKQEMITIYPGRYNKPIFLHDPKATDNRDFTGNPSELIETLSDREFMDVYQALMKR